MFRIDELEWKLYPGDREIAEHRGGFYVIRPKVTSTSNITFYCRLCSTVMRSSDDEAANREFRCCHMCALQFAHPRRKEWLEDGWRPTQEDVALVASERPQHVKFFF